MKKILILIVFALALPSAMNAQSESQRLVVWQKSGEKVYFDLDEEPETTFEAGKLVITTSKTTAYYQLENVLRYTFEGQLGPTTIAKARPGEIKFSQGEDMMKFEGLADGTRLELYSVDGKLLGVQQARAGEPSIVSLKDMPLGTYIVKAGEATYKFQKR